MITLDEAIAKEKEGAKRLRKIIETGYDGEISIEALFCDDASAIKEAYERFENCAEEHEQIAEWLEKLKELKSGTVIKSGEYPYFNGFKDGKEVGYNKAIDDFVEKVKNYHYILSDKINSTDYGMLIRSVEIITGKQNI